MEQKILVTGATGTIGSHVVKFLKDKNAYFSAMVRSVEKEKPFKDQGIETVIADLSEQDALKRAMHDIEILFLLSATSPLSPELQGNAVKVAKESGVKHIVKVAARGSSKNANFNIGKWHGLTEEEIRQSGIPYTFLHAHTFMQNLLFDADTVKKENAIYSTQGDGKIPMIDTRDIAAVATTVLTAPDVHAFKTYELTGPEAVSYHEIARELTRLLGREISYKKQTPEEGRKAMLDGGMPEWLVDDMIKLNKRYAENEATEVSPDVEKLLRRAPLSLQEFLNDYKHKFEN